VHSALAERSAEYATSRGVTRSRPTGEQRQRRQPAVVRERPEDSIKLRHVYDGAQRRRRDCGGERPPVGGVAGAGREAARGHAVRSDAIDHAQALGDAVLRVHTSARLDRAGDEAVGQQARHQPLVEQPVAVRHVGVVREHHRGSTSV
jgi:hypothetical protein